MTLKKVMIFTALSFLPPLTSNVHLHITFPEAELPDLKGTICQINNTIENFNTTVTTIPANAAALCILYFSARQLFIKSPEKDTAKRTMIVDWGFPLAGLCASSYILWACNRR